MRLTDLAEAVLLTKQSMGYLVDDLEALGYVERASEPGERRAKLVRLTARGRQVDDTVREVIRMVEEEWAARLGEEEHAQFTRLLRALIAMLEDRP